MRLANTSRRRGTVTIIVVSFLLLLLIMGMTFAFYGLREAEEARVYRDSQNGGQTGVDPTSRGSSNPDQPPEPETIFSSTMNSVIFGASDDVSGAFNVLRNQEIARTIYGWDPVNPTNANQPFNGIGRVPPDVMFQGLGLPATLIPPDRVNWAWMPDLGQTALLDSDNNWVRDPRTNQPAPVLANYRYFARNANYTYPDLNNMFMAVVDPRSGRVVIPSYHRPYILSGGGAPPNPPYQASGQLTIDPNNDWTSQFGRMKILRPRPFDNQWAGTSEFPYPVQNPDGSYGDVENLAGKAGGRQLDSLWMDLDLPVGYWRGKAYKPLVAMLITDLDGRVNLNTAGNYYVNPSLAGMSKFPGVQNRVHSSLQGIGTWEVNPGKVFNANEASRMVVGDPTRSLHPRYGSDVIPNKRWSANLGEIIFPNVPSPGSGAHWYGAVSFSGQPPNLASPQYFAGSTGHETSMVWGPPYKGNPQAMPAGSDPPRPDETSRYGSGWYIQLPPSLVPPGYNPYYDDRSDHPMLFNPYLVRSRQSAAIATNPNAPTLDRTYGPEEMRILNGQYNYGDLTKSAFYPMQELVPNPPGQPVLAPDSLMQPYYPANLPNRRWLVTTQSNDINIPGSTPWLASSNTNYMLNPPNTTAPNQPVGIGNPPTFNLATTPGGTADHDQYMRAKLTGLLGPVDIDRKLTDYRSNTTQPYSPNNMGFALQALQDRQALAKDIFDRLRFATMGDINNPISTPPGPAYDALRWLAQLAVNIVDYVDNDDIMTVWQWNPAGPDVKSQYVVGFERPRLVINETYTRYENNPTDPKNVDPNTGNPKADPNLGYSLRMWVELHNPVTPGNEAERTLGPEGNDPTNKLGGYRAKLTDQLGGAEKTVYRLLITKYTKAMAQPAGVPFTDLMEMRKPDNVFGDPGMTTPIIKTVDFANANQVKNVDAVRGKTIEPNIGAAIRCAGAAEQQLLSVGPGG